MKRKVFMMFLAATMLGSSVCGLSGCGTEESIETVVSTEDSEIPEDSKTAGNDTAEENFTVTFYDSDGTTVLSTEEVAAGETATEYAPEKDGYTFAGWFATPQMSHKFDFATEITGDTSVFAGFVSYVEDTRQFAIVGSGTSDVLMESNWGAVIGDAQMLEKEEVDGENIYTITLDLEAGDEFQFAIDDSWADQRGYGYLTTIEQDGVEYFANSGGLGDTGVKKANIKVAVSGNYTFCLTTYPGEDTYDTSDAYYSESSKECFNYNAYDTITWTYNGEGNGGENDYETDYYIKGAVITGWEDVYTDETRFTNEDGIYTLTISLEEGDEFLFTTLLTSGDTSSVGNEYVRYTNIAENDSDSLSYVTGTDTANIVALETGTYTFTYDPSAKILTVAFE